jgi:hypothetical protein
MVGSKNSEWGATRIWHGRAPRDTLPVMAQPFFLFSVFTGTEGDFIDLKWMKKVEDFRSRWLFVDILEESELFLIIGVPPIKLTTWASEALPEEALKTLRPRIRDLQKAGVTETMVGVEFVTRRIAPLQDHRREIWRHRARDDLGLHVSELNADA